MAPEILICDDEPHVTRAIALKLSRADYAVHTVSDGQAAWESLQRMTPAMMIADCQMPEMDGLELVERIRQSPDLADLPVILLTDHCDESVEGNERILRLGIAHVVPKPFSPRHLLALVDDVLCHAPVTV